MQTTIGEFDADKNQVAVTFVAPGPDGEAVTHMRFVNACRGEDGAYDEPATATRIAQVGAGVLVKIGLGAITNPPPAPEPAIEPAAG